MEVAITSWSLPVSIWTCTPLHRSNVESTGGQPKPWLCETIGSQDRWAPNRSTSYAIPANKPYERSLEREFLARCGEDVLYGPRRSACRGQCLAGSRGEQTQGLSGAGQ